MAIDPDPGTRSPAAPADLPAPASRPVLRRVDLGLEELDDPVWNPDAAEFVAAANAVSLLMPFVEPYFAGAVRRALPELAPELSATARTFVRQELEHQRQHRRFNVRLVERFAGLRRPERRARRTYGWLARTRSLRFSLAFAAASETIAYSLARWTSDHLAEFLRGADPVATDLFVWHLAEEVEHKSVAFDVWASVDGSRWRYARAGVLSLVLLGWLSLWSILVQLHEERRLLRPATWWRTARLVLGFTFEVVPTMFLSSLPGHHPDQLADPDWYGRWLVDLEHRRGAARPEAPISRPA
ncbi:metal-dependent hydrolase [Dermatobacter hominis]|uniref:metal-dependent hydrolase n=1 Tax=Dermatobacter hominis TaxID=2884263 RepID=UPI001D11990D|nr:metal-dependent hydrolase [Dermatobacter hominis]UDY36528.1 metal-dependent hydrolase [Dermatobacter hominis]